MHNDKLKAITDQLCCRFPNAFFRNGGRRRPLKLGIDRDILAVLGHTIDAKDLRFAMRVYVSNTHYLKAQTASARRIDLDGNECGVVTEVDAANAQQRLVAIAAKRKQAKPTAKVKTAPRPEPKAELPVEPKVELPVEAKAEPPKPRRLGLADLRAAGQRRKAAAA